MPRKASAAPKNKKPTKPKPAPLRVTMTPTNLPDGCRPANAAELRKAAESADGRRGRALCLIYAVENGQDPNTGTYAMYDENDPDDVAKYATCDRYDIVDTE